MNQKNFLTNLNGFDFIIIVVVVIKIIVIIIIIIVVVVITITWLRSYCKDVFILSHDEEI